MNSFIMWLDNYSAWNGYLTLKPKILWLTNPWQQTDAPTGGTPNIHIQILKSPKILILIESKHNLPLLHTEQHNVIS